VQYENQLAFASVGDCELILASCNSNRVKRLNVIHSSKSKRERKRIEDADGYVKNGRAMGVLEPTRTIGDLDVKRTCPGAIIAEPDVGLVDLSEHFSSDQAAIAEKSYIGDVDNCGCIESFIIIATDGVFEAMDK